MKIKKLLIPLLLLISCMLAFSACSKDAEFNFDENSIVKLKYTCTDEEKNFEAELTSGQSRDFILCLNKITYFEAADNADFGPSYDSLEIIIGEDKLNLPDVGFRINNGGYLYFNGKLCKSEEKFSFLTPYLAEYGPVTVPNGIPFGIQYVKQTVGAEENCQIIKSVGQLNDYIAGRTPDTDLPDFELFKDEVINKYDGGYFENSFIVIFMKETTSGSFGFRVNGVSVSGDSLFIDYEIVLPEGYGEDISVTCDMAYWYSFVEISNEYASIKNVHLTSLK